MSPTIGWRVTPLLTVAALLLVPVPQAVGRRIIQLPVVWTTVAVPEKGAYIAVEADGEVRVSAGWDMSLPVRDSSELDARVAAIVRANPRVIFILNIDKRAQYGVVAGVFSILSKHGVKKVYLLAEQRTKPYPKKFQEWLDMVTGRGHSRTGRDRRGGKHEASGE
ncbi:MAG: biopolymer transporter ExbD [Acidobacteria bacterium]|nr:biopolymer transporter ExbD [Acidobacteriota bacterium]